MNNNINKDLEMFYNGVNRIGMDTIKWEAGEKRVGKSNLLPLWVADSDYETCPEVKKALIERADNGTFGYTFASSKYFDILENWFKTRHGYNIKKDMVVITPGIVNALYFIVRCFTEEKNSILINSPVYNPFYDVIKNNGRYIVNSKAVRVDINPNFFTYKLDFNDLEEKIKNCKLYILCNPHNPIGRCYTKEELKRIVSLCKKYNCILVSDEIHCDLVMNGEEFTSVGSFANEYDKIIICTAPSKTFNVAGLSDSNILFFNKDLYDVFAKAYYEMEIELNVFGYTACMAAYTKGASWVDNQNLYLSSQRDLVYEWVKKNNLKVCKLEGTYLMWIDMTSICTDQEVIFKGLIDNGVWINNGTMYDSECNGYIRINVACGRGQLIEGLERIENFINTLKK